MRTSLFTGCLLIEALAHGQGFNSRYDVLNKGRAESGNGIEIVSDGYVTLSSYEDVDSLGPDSFFFHASVALNKTALDGTQVWQQRTFRNRHSAFSGWANCCDTVPGGGFVVGGSSEDTLGNDEVYLMRFNAEGDTLWTRVFGDPNLNDYWIGRQVKRTEDGGFLIVGDTDADGSVNGFVIKTNSMGIEQWRETYGNGLIDYFIASDRATHGYILGGVDFIGVDNSQLWVQRIDTLGSVLWSVVWGGPFEEPSAHLITLADGHVLVASAIGHAIEFGAGAPYLAKLDSTDGSLLWDREYGVPTYGTTLFAAKERPNGDLIAAGVCYYGGDQQGLLLRTTSEGDSIWMRSYFYQDTLMQDGTGRFYDVLPTEDGGFIAAGAAYHSGTIGYPEGYSQDTWVVKVDSMGCVVPGCDGVGVTEVITNFSDALLVYPNPAHGQVQLSLQLPQHMQRKELHLTIVGSDGGVVRRVPWQGTERMQLDVQDLSPGLYTLHLTAGTTWISGTKLMVE